MSWKITHSKTCDGYGYIYLKRNSLTVTIQITGHNEASIYYDARPTKDGYTLRIGLVVHRVPRCQWRATMQDLMRKAKDIDLLQALSEKLEGEE